MPKQSLMEPTSCIPFSGPLVPDLTEDVRALYLRRNRVVHAIYAILGVVVLVNAYVPGQPVAAFLFRVPPAVPGPMRLDARLTFTGAAVAMFLLAFALGPLWWRWWWPQIEETSGGMLAGEACREGLRWADGAEIIPWSSFIAAKLSDRAALLYLTKAYAVPFHRSLFRDASTWEAFQQLVRESRIRIGWG
jgi:hypothetical protein